MEAITHFILVLVALGFIFSAAWAVVGVAQFIILTISPKPSPPIADGVSMFIKRVLLTAFFFFTFYGLSVLMGLPA